MKNQKTNRLGFTLIELLVVVLIIGILAAVALPQYQKAVNKSRFAEIWSNLAAMYRVAQISIEQGQYDQWGGTLEVRTDEMDIELPCEAYSVTQCLVYCPVGEKQYPQCTYTVSAPSSNPTDITAKFTFDRNGVDMLLTLDRLGRHCSGSDCAKYGQDNSAITQGSRP